MLATVKGSPGPPQLKMWTQEWGSEDTRVCPTAEPGLSAWLEPVPTPPRSTYTHTSGREWPMAREGPQMTAGQVVEGQATRQTRKTRWTSRIYKPVESRVQITSFSKTSEAGREASPMPGGLAITPESRHHGA